MAANRTSPGRDERNARFVPGGQPLKPTLSDFFRPWQGLRRSFEPSCPPLKWWAIAECPCGTGPSFPLFYRPRAGDAVGATNPTLAKSASSYPYPSAASSITRRNSLPPLDRSTSEGQGPCPPQDGRFGLELLIHIECKNCAIANAPGSERQGRNRALPGIRTLGSKGILIAHACSHGRAFTS